MRHQVTITEAEIAEWIREQIAAPLPAEMRIAIQDNPGLVEVFSIGGDWCANVDMKAVAKAANP